MQDRIPVNPGRVLISPESGSPYYATMTRADNATQEGTPLNKNSLLKDATAALFGLGADAVPDDVLSAIKTLIDGSNANANAKAKIATGSYTGTGTSGSSNPNSLTFDFVPTMVCLVGINNGGKLGAYPFGTSGYFVAPVTLTTSYAAGHGFYSSTSNYSYGKKSSDGKTVYWYNTDKNSGSSYQFNTSGATYYYFAIG